MSIRMGLIAVACLIVPAVPASDENRWLTDYRQALEVARAQGKPLFVVFRCEH